MIKTFFTSFFLFISCSLLGETVKDRFLESNPGDFVVFVHDKYMTLLLIDESSPKNLVIEEITAPSSVLKVIGGNWQNWIDNNAPQSTSWTTTKISLENDTIEYVYSFSNNKLYPQENTVSFLPTLLSQNLIPIPFNMRKLSGPEPLEGETDFRKVWTPKITFNGKNIEGQVSAYSIIWPKDDSDLSEKKVDLYFSDKALKFFPYWVEIQGKFAKVKLFVIDSGKGLSSQKKVPL